MRLMSISGPAGISRPRARLLSVMFHYYESVRNVVGILSCDIVLGTCVKNTERKIQRERERV